MLLGVVCHSAAIVQATNGVKEVLHEVREGCQGKAKSVVTQFIRGGGNVVANYSYQPTSCAQGKWLPTCVY